MVELSGNTTVAAVATGALEAVWSSHERHWAQRASDDGAYPDSKAQREVLRAHRRLVSAIATGDAEAAIQSMRGHLLKSQSYVSDVEGQNQVPHVLEPEPTARTGGSG